MTTATSEEVPGTARKRIATGSSATEFNNSKIVLIDVYFDMLALLADMDVIPEA